MITARKTEDGSYEVLNGHMRLKATIQAFGKAEVTDAASGATLFVYEVNGQLVALSADAQASLEDQAVAAINRARR
jgi:hypothetical protein